MDTIEEQTNIVREETVWKKLDKQQNYLLIGLLQLLLELNLAVVLRFHSFANFNGKYLRLVTSWSHFAIMLFKRTCFYNA